MPAEARSLPLHHGWHGRLDRIDVAAGLEAEDGAAVVEQVEFDISAAAHELLLALGLAPRLGEVSAHEFGIDRQEGAADLLREGEGRVPVALEIIVEDAADAAHLVAVLEEEVLIAPRLVFVVGRERTVRVARGLHRRVKRDRIRIRLRPTAVEHRREIGAAAEPGLRRDDEARVHVHGGHVRIMQMCDQRDARGPETWILGRARDLPAELRRELAEYGRAVHAALLDDAAAPHVHDAAATGAAGMVGAAPRRTHESAGLAVAEWRTGGQGVLQRLEGSADVVALTLAPGTRFGLAGIEDRGLGQGGHERFPVVPAYCRRASPATLAAAMATLSERKPSRIGIRRRVSAARCTASGTPALSRPSITISCGEKAWSR